jgi:arachidonate 15-lipoxygenase
MRHWGVFLGDLLPTFVMPPGVVELADLLTLVIYTSSAQHAAVNFAQYPLMSFAPVVAGAAWSDAIPSSEDEAAMLPFFSPLDLAQKQAHVLFLLSSVHHTRLGQYPAQHFRVQGVDRIVADFRSALDRVERDIDRANAHRPWPYMHLRPSVIPQSINI